MKGAHGSAGATEAPARGDPSWRGAFQQNMGHVHVTAVGGENPFGFIVAAVDGVLGMARAAGLDLPMAKSSTSAS
jgi:hypothetical protein